MRRTNLIVFLVVTAALIAAVGCLGIFGSSTSFVRLLITIEGVGQVEGPWGTADGQPKTFAKGTTVSLEAVPGSQWAFWRWEGSLDSTANPVTITLDKDAAVTAVFREDRPFILTTSVQGGGTVELTPPGPGYGFGTVVQLEAVPDPGWIFRYWQGDKESTANPVQMVMDDDYTVVAVFDPVGTGGANTVSGSVTVEHSFPWSPVDGAVQHTAAAEVSFSAPVRNSVQLDADANEMIVRFAPGTSEDEKQAVLARENWVLLERLDPLDAFLVQLSSGNVWTMSAAAVRDSRIINAHPNNRVYPLGTVVPNDPYYERQWHYRQIRLPQAWSVTTGSSSVRIAVLDTGVDTSHPDLRSRLDLANAYNFVGQNRDVTDRSSNGHGTHVAGTIGAAGNNGRGVTGVMWDSTILPLKVLEPGGTDFGVASAILYAAGQHDTLENPQPVDIINLSLGGSNPLPLTEAALVKAFQAGILVVGAAGNSGSQGVIYPARYSQVIAVGAVDFNYPNAPERAYYSNYGTQLELAAPGGDRHADSNNDGREDSVFSTVLAGSYGYAQGTSMAAPHVAGLLGLMLANGIPANRARTVLANTAVDLGTPGRDPFFGYGLVNAYWAVNDVSNIRILLGRWEGSVFSVHQERTVGLQGGDFVFADVEDGEYVLMAVVDVQNNGQLQAGDHWGEAFPIVVSGGQDIVRHFGIAELSSDRGIYSYAAAFDRER